MKNSTPRIPFPKLQLLNYLAKFLTERKYLMKLYEAETYLDEIIKSQILKQIASLEVMMALKQYFINILQMN